MENVNNTPTGMKPITIVFIILGVVLLLASLGAILYFTLLSTTPPPTASTPASTSGSTSETDKKSTGTSTVSPNISLSGTSKTNAESTGKSVVVTAEKPVSVEASTSTSKTSTPGPINGYYGPNSKIWNDNDCANIGDTNQKTLSACQGSCTNTSGCTAINYNPKTDDGRFGDCVLRACPSGKAPSWSYAPYVGYAKYSI